MGCRVLLIGIAGNPMLQLTKHLGLHSTPTLQQQHQASQRFHHRYLEGAHHDEAHQADRRVPAGKSETSARLKHKKPGEDHACGNQRQAALPTADQSHRGHRRIEGDKSRFIEPRIKQDADDHAHGKHGRSQGPGTPAVLAALFLQQCGYRGEEPLFDPMCGSGTFVLEAAEQVARLNPGRERSFAFEGLVSFDQAAWSALRAVRRVPRAGLLCHGSDRDAGAIAMATANAERAGLAEVTRFQVAPISSVVPPAGPPGLVMVNPPYGARLAEGTDLRPLYQSLGRVLRERFVGWRIGMVTSEPRLAAATALPFLPPGPPVPHGGLRVRLYRTSPLAP